MPFGLQTAREKSWTVFPWHWSEIKLGKLCLSVLTAIEFLFESHHSGEWETMCTCARAFVFFKDHSNSWPKNISYEPYQNLRLSDVYSIIFHRIRGRTVDIKMTKNDLGKICSTTPHIVALSLVQMIYVTVMLTPTQWLLTVALAELLLKGLNLQFIAIC